MNFKTYEDLTSCIVKNLYKIPRDIDLIVGIPRSGTMAGNIIALYLNLPFTDIDTFINNGNIRSGTTRKSQRWIKKISEARKVLLVDDSISSGKAIRETKLLIKEKGLSTQIIYLAIYALLSSKHMVDIFFEICEQPRMFEWNYMHHWALEFCCMDIDGVICENPTLFQNDDSKRYYDFVKNAMPKFIPTQKVGRFVTTRLEKYRLETEIWLKKYNIEYDELIMLEGMSAKERKIRGAHASFKASVYKQCDAFLFFESDYDQALEICNLSGKPVFCVENRTLLTSDNIEQKIKVRSKELSVTIKRIVRKVANKIHYVS